MVSGKILLEENIFGKVESLISNTGQWTLPSGLTCFILGKCISGEDKLLLVIKKTHFWQDAWCGEIPFGSIFACLFLFIINIPSLLLN
jgi:hypothetical protein